MNKGNIIQALSLIALGFLATISLSGCSLSASQRSTPSLLPHHNSGLSSTTKSATLRYYENLDHVNYSSVEMREIKAVSRQQHVKFYIPSKMGGPSGWYVPGSPQGSKHVVFLPFEDMAFYEAPSWNTLIKSNYFNSPNVKLTIDKGGIYKVNKVESGQWYTLNYSNGAMRSLFILQKGTTWIGIEPNAAKVPILPLIQAVSKTLELI